MIPLQVITEVSARLKDLNENNGIHFSARFWENHIFIDKSEHFVTSCYCRIEYYEHRELIKVKYYDFRLNQFELQGVRFKKEILEDNLGVLLEKDIRME